MPHEPSAADSSNPNATDPPDPRETASLREGRAQPPAIAGVDPPGDADLHCPECDYNLTGTVGDRCSWCGWPIDVGVLVEAANLARSNRRIGVGVAALVVAIGSSAAYARLALGSDGLGTRDVAAAIGVAAASCGHLALAFLALRRTRRWPIRSDDARAWLRLAGWAAVILGIVGASDVLSRPASPLRAVGGEAIHVLEFLVTALLFGLPGWALLGLLPIAFHTRRGWRTRGRSRTGPDTPCDDGPAPFVVEVYGRYAEDRLAQSVETAGRPSTPEIDRLVEQCWQAEQAGAASAGRELHDGKLGRLVRLKATDSELHLTLGDTSYRDFLGTHARHLATVLAAGAEHLANPLGTSALIATSDGYLALGRRGDRVTLHAGYLHTFGGMLEAADRAADGSYDVFGAIRRELREELALHDAELQELVISGLVRDTALAQPELLFDVTLALTRSDLEERFAPALSGGEHVAVAFLLDEPEAAVRFIEQAAPITPVAQAALVLHGRHQWGTDWYEASCYVLYGAVPGTDLTAALGLHGGA